MGVEKPSEPQILQSIITYTQVVIITITIAGKKLYRVVGLPVPRYDEVFALSKWQYSFIIFYLGNFIKSGVGQGGQFDVFVDTQLIYSKFETG